MRRRLLPALAACCLALLTASAGVAAMITVSGDVSYDGSYDTANNLYVIVYDLDADTAVGADVIAVGAPPFTEPYSIDYDNTGVSATVIVAAALDVDNSGFSPSDPATPADVVGWYDSEAEPTELSSGVSHSGLDFELPTGEIRGTVTFAPGQFWANIMACSVPNMWCPQDIDLWAGGSYEIRGLYPGGWTVHADGSLGDICYGDPTCVSPTVVTLTDGEIRTGIDIDFTVIAVETESWGRIKAGYR